MRENAAALNTAVGELRHSVIRVVRTATPEVDRRSRPRYEVDLACRLTVAGQAFGARVADLSRLRRLRLRGAPELPAGRGGALGIDGVGFSLPFTVKLSDGNSLHVAFALDATAAAAFSGIPERLAQRRAA